MTANPINCCPPIPAGPLRISESSTVDAGINQPYFSLVIPTYNECANIKNIIRILSQLLDDFLPGDYELIVVDDDSPDRTWEIAHSLLPEYPQ